MAKEHTYQASLKWTGNSGKGTRSYTSYERSHEIKVEGKDVIQCSSDPTFRGDPSKYNPEDFLISSIASCHMLWYLHLCTVNKITVVEYQDAPEGIMVENKDGSGYFKEATLKPIVTILEKDKTEKAQQLHHEAHKYCFIANSVNFPILNQPEIRVATQV